LGAFADCAPGLDFAFADSGRSLTAFEVKRVVAIAAGCDREPTILQVGKNGVFPAGWEILESESWMWASGSVGARVGTLPSGVSVRVVERPDEAMLKVFEDVYIAAAPPDAIGYTELPADFRDAYQLGLATYPAQALHIGLSLNGVCAAIATISIVGRAAGLYFVGTHRDFRRQGLASLVTTCACAEAFTRGADGVFLQTVADSPIEGLYASLGFERQFIGHYAAP
jgi:ribosomal protein S18 acetylase RimI-like enzyme